VGEGRTEYPIIHFVGSIPLSDAETAGPYLRPLPDRETGIRKTWNLITPRMASAAPAHPAASPAALWPSAPHQRLRPVAAAPRCARNRGTSPRTEHHSAASPATRGGRWPRWSSRPVSPPHCDAQRAFWPAIPCRSARLSSVGRSRLPMQGLSRPNRARDKPIRQPRKSLLSFGDREFEFLSLRPSTSSGDCPPKTGTNPRAD
jgi:hypothetical protein